MTISRELAEFATGYGAGSFAVGRNRIINGDMRIDQRNAGALVAGAVGSIYGVDRVGVGVFGSGTGRISAQQSSTAPSSFVNSLVSTVTTADAAPSAAYGYCVFQRIEGNNIADLGWGSASAKSVTVSFWVRSSIAGDYVISLINNDASLAYATTYTISSANTFEYKTVTIAGPTSGTWVTGTGIGVGVNFGLGGGSSRQATLDSWYAPTGGYTPTDASGCVDWIATSGATFYITGVQLEEGTVATPFERRQYGQELALCQRYLPAFSGEGRIAFGMGATTSAGVGFYSLPVTARVAPTGLVVNNAGYFYVSDAVSYDLVCNSITFADASTTMVRFNFGTSSASQVANRPQSYWSGNSAAILYFTGCEL